MRDVRAGSGCSHPPRSRWAVLGVLAFALMTAAVQPLVASTDRRGSPVTEPDDEGERRRTYNLEIGLAKIEGK